MKEEHKDVEAKIAKVDYELFTSFFKDLMEKYTNGEVTLSIVGPRVGGGISDPVIRELTKKHNLAPEKFEQCVSATVMSLHYVVSEEKDTVIQILKEEKREEEARELERKFNFVQGIVEQFPKIRSQYLLQSYCKSLYLADFSWEADVKFFNSPVEYTKKEPPSPFPTGRIRFTLASPEFPTDLLKRTSFDLEVSQYDVETMIRGLEQLKTALLKLKEAKYTQGD